MTARGTLSSTARNEWWSPACPFRRRVFQRRASVPGQSPMRRRYPDRGAWLEFDLTPGDILSVNNDNRKKNPVTMLHKASAFRITMNCYGSSAPNRRMTIHNEVGPGSSSRVGRSQRGRPDGDRRYGRLTKENLDTHWNIGRTTVGVWNVDNALASTLERDNSEKQR
jgi:DNA-directed RNA polymerase subunit beta